MKPLVCIYSVVPIYMYRAFISYSQLDQTHKCLAIHVYNIHSLSVCGIYMYITIFVSKLQCGFFRRKNKQQIEDQARENLTEENTAM